MLLLMMSVVSVANPISSTHPRNGVHKLIIVIDTRLGVVTAATTASDIVMITMTTITSFFFFLI